MIRHERNLLGESVSAIAVLLKANVILTRLLRPLSA